MAIGDGKIVKGEKHPIVVKVGQKVMYKKWGGNEIKVNNGMDLASLNKILLIQNNLNVPILLMS